MQTLFDAPQKVRVVDVRCIIPPPRNDIHLCSILLRGLPSLAFFCKKVSQNPEVDKKNLLHFFSEQKRKL
jgi:hypothetical protein